VNKMIKAGIIGASGITGYELTKLLKKHPQVEIKLLNSKSCAGKKVKEEFPDFGDDEDENALEVADYSDRLSMEHVLEKQLRDVNSALARIADGTYGIDKYTGEPINEKRLLTRPTSSTNVETKKQLKGEA